eukprot:scaffold30_cov255-Pinguiococcus_pyrenoidosus.AAC.26
MCPFTRRPSQLGIQQLDRRASTQEKRQPKAASKFFTSCTFPVSTARVLFPTAPRWPFSFLQGVGVHVVINNRLRSFVTSTLSPGGALVRIRRRVVLQISVRALSLLPMQRPRATISQAHAAGAATPHHPIFLGLALPKHGLHQHRAEGAILLLYIGPSTQCILSGKCFWEGQTVPNLPRAWRRSCGDLVKLPERSGASPVTKHVLAQSREQLLGLLRRQAPSQGPQAGTDAVRTRNNRLILNEIVEAFLDLRKLQALQRGYMLLGQMHPSICICDARFDRVCKGSERDIARCLRAEAVKHVVRRLVRWRGLADERHQCSVAEDAAHGGSQQGRALRQPRLGLLNAFGDDLEGSARVGRLAKHRQCPARGRATQDVPTLPQCLQEVAHQSLNLLSPPCRPSIRAPPPHLQRQSCARAIIKLWLRRTFLLVHVPEEPVGVEELQGSSVVVHRSVPIAPPEVQLSQVGEGGRHKVAVRVVGPLGHVQGSLELPLDGVEVPRLRRALRCVAVLNRQVVQQATDVQVRVVAAPHHRLPVRRIQRLQRFDAVAAPALGQAVRVAQQARVEARVRGAALPADFFQGAGGLRGRRRRAARRQQL